MVLKIGQVQVDSNLVGADLTPPKSPTWWVPMILDPKWTFYLVFLLEKGVYGHFIVRVCEN